MTTLAKTLEMKIEQADSIWQTYTEESDKLSSMRKLSFEPARIHEQEARVQRWYTKGTELDNEIAWLEADMEAQAGPYGYII